MRALLRPWFWACGASIALAAAITIVGRSEIGAQRVTNALAAIYGPSTPALAEARAERDTTGAIRTQLVQAPALAKPRDTATDDPSIKFGIDLGSAPSMEILRAQWAVAQANHAALLEGLRPVIGVNESKPGTPELRLIVGPLPNIASASKLCGALAALRTYCRTAVFDGQRLASTEPTSPVAPPPIRSASAECHGKPDALGTSRVLKVSAGEFAALGTMQYRHTLPLADREVVLTFDDGPLPPYTDRVLQALAAECVKATYFLIGRQARNFPEAVRRIHHAGHTIGTHSQHHAYTLASMSQEAAAREIDAGFASVAESLGDATLVAPFFRFPGLMHSKAAERHLASRSISIWSADADADDWQRHLGAGEVLRRALARLEAKGRGVMLLHDIQPSTVMMLPALLRELKKRGYRIVHVVPNGIERPRELPVAAPGDGKPEKQAWPRVSALQ